MTTSARATASGVTRSPVDRAWAVGTPMTPVGFYPTSGPLPGVVEVRDQTGPWDAVGQTRQLMLSDGGSVIEHVVLVDEPAPLSGPPGHPGRFVYELSDFQKLIGRLVSGARADWRYSAEESGTRILWSYTFFARPGMGLALRAIVGLLWGPYMRRVLPGIIAEIDREP